MNERQMRPDFSYEENPGYLDLVTGIYKSAGWYYRKENWGNYSFPSSFISDFRHYYFFKLDESYPIFYWAIFFTLLRYLFELFICKPITSYLNFTHKSDRNKFPESFWKFVAYSALWSYSAYLLIYCGRHTYFAEPEKIWDDWELGMVVPDEIKFLYFIECGFYMHSLYATIFMDAWRKDFFVMILHHFLTMALIIASYATRYHKIGILVIFVHDVTDILLEFTKCNVYLKNRNGKFYSFHDMIANIGFVTFTLAWFLFRLYWFPLKIIYSSGVIAIHRAYYRGAGLYAFFNSLLVILLILDIYWFYFILLFLYKVATGQLSGVSDTREDDDEGIVKAVKKEEKKEK